MSSTVAHRSASLPRLSPSLEKESFLVETVATIGFIFKFALGLFKATSVSGAKPRVG